MILRYGNSSPNQLGSDNISELQLIAVKKGKEKKKSRKSWTGEGDGKTRNIDEKTKRKFDQNSVRFNRFPIPIESNNKFKGNENFKNTTNKGVQVVVWQW